MLQPALQDEPRRSRGVLGPRLTENLPKTDPEISGQTAFRYPAPGCSIVLPVPGPDLASGARFWAGLDRKPNANGQNQRSQTARAFRGGRFKRLKNMYLLSRPGPRELPKSARNGGPGPPRYSRTVLGNHWISKLWWGTGWAPLGCPGQNAYFQYKMPPKEPPRCAAAKPNVKK